MKKKSVLLIVGGTVLVSLMLVISIIVLLSKDTVDESQPSSSISEDNESVPDNTDPYIIEDKTVVVGEDGRTFGEIIDERADGTDKSTGTIVVPNSDLSAYDDSVRGEVKLTVEEASDDLLLYSDLLPAPADYIMSETMDYYSNQFDVEDITGFIYTLETLLATAGFSTEVSLVRCPAPYTIIGEDYWRIGYTDKVYTLILQDNRLWLFDQGIPFDDSVRVI